MKSDVAVEHDLPFFDFIRFESRRQRQQKTIHGDARLKLYAARSHCAGNLALGSDVTLRIDSEDRSDLSLRIERAELQQAVTIFVQNERRFARLAGRAS